MQNNKQIYKRATASYRQSTQTRHTHTYICINKDSHLLSSPSVFIFWFFVDTGGYWKWQWRHEPNENSQPSCSLVWLGVGMCITVDTCQQLVHIAQLMPPSSSLLLLMLMLLSLFLFWFLSTRNEITTTLVSNRKVFVAIQQTWLRKNAPVCVLLCWHKTNRKPLLRSVKHRHASNGARNISQKAHSPNHG